MPRIKKIRINGMGGSKMFPIEKFGAKAGRDYPSSSKYHKNKKRGK